MSDFAESLAPGGAHHLLHQLVGEWEGTTKTWFEPGKLADESPWSGTIRPIYDGRFVLYEYEGLIEGNPLRGTVTFGFNLPNGRYEASWLDTFHMGTGILFSEGPRTEHGFSVLGSWAANDGTRWGWRTEVELRDADHLVITQYIITPDGREGKGVETEYRRK